MTYSPDLLALNPELAAQQKRRKAKTPSGKGYGYTDDSQTYAAAGLYVHLSPDKQLSTAAEQFIGQFKRYARHCSPETVERVWEMVEKAMKDGTAV